MQIEHKVIPHCIWDNDCDKCQTADCVATYDQALAWYREHEIGSIIDTKPPTRNRHSDDEDEEEGW